MLSVLCFTFQRRHSSTCSASDMALFITSNQWWVVNTYIQCYLYLSDFFECTLVLMQHTFTYIVFFREKSLLLLCYIWTHSLVMFLFYACMHIKLRGRWSACPHVSWRSLSSAATPPHDTVQCSIMAEAKARVWLSNNART